MKTKGYRVFGCLLLICAIALLAAPGNSQSAFLDDEGLLAGWVSTYGSVRTMRVSYRNILVDYQPPQVPSENPDEQFGRPVKHIHVERTEAGKRYHLRYSLAADGFDDPEWLVEYAFNGKNTQSYMGSTESGMISPGQRGGNEEAKNDLNTFMFLTNRRGPKVLREEYPNGLPELVCSYELTKLGGRVVVRPKLEYVAGEPCHVLELIDDADYRGEPRELKDVYWMAHEKGMCVMKHQALRNGAVEREIAVEKIAAADMNGNTIWYPQKAYRSTCSDIFGTTKNELTVTDFVPNVAVDDRTFRFDFPPGTRVSDRVLGLSYVVGGGDPDGEVSSVRDISSAEKSRVDIEAAGKAPETLKSSSQPKVEEANQTPGEDTQRKEEPTPEESVPEKKRILGLRTLSIVGAIVLAGLGLLLWHKRSTNR